jgi:hypothetical protein
MASRRYVPATFKRPPLAATSKGLLAALAALYDGEGESLIGEAALAEKERIRIEDEQRLRRQGELRLVSKGRQ